MDSVPVVLMFLAVWIAILVVQWKLTRIIELLEDKKNDK